MSALLLITRVTLFGATPSPFSDTSNVQDGIGRHAGVWSWACGYAGYKGDHPRGYYEQECFNQVLDSPPPSWLRGWFQLIYWRDLEPEDGVFDWRAFDANLTLAAKNGIQVQPVIYIYDCARPMPAWMRNISRPIKFYRERGGPLEEAPNFLDPAFQGRWQRVIKQFAKHLDSLPTEQRQSVWAVQAVAGITGDNRPWNGSPAHSADDISASEWMDYTRKVADIYIDAFLPTHIPVIANLHEGFSNQRDQGWFLQRAFAKGMRGAAVKEGVPTHWYNVNGEQLLYEEEAHLLLTPQPDGSFASARGELAVEPDPELGTYGNWAHSPWWSLQATAEWCLTFGIDVWNLYSGFIGNASFAPTMDFFNRHAGYKDPSTARAAFISFRDSLDTADVVRWPVSTFGPVNDTKDPDRLVNRHRMQQIATLNAHRGASLGTTDGAFFKAGVHQKKAMELYDVCWECFRGNYGRFLTQLDPPGSSVGWWQLGPRDQPYGRFARGLEHSSGRNTIRLRLDPQFGTTGQRALARVVYFDRGDGRWALGYGGAAAASVKKHNTLSWLVAEVNITLLAPRTGSSHLTLSSLDRQDDVFSLIEVLLLDKPLSVS